MNESKLITSQELIYLHNLILGGEEVPVQLAVLGAVLLVVWLMLL